MVILTFFAVWPVFGHETNYNLVSGLSNFQGLFELPFPLGEGFGFNFNIFETNLINLSVVIGIVVSFGGNALRSILDNRKQIILNNLEEADKKAQEAQDKLNKTKTQLELARKKAAEIREQGIIQADQDKQNCIFETKNEVSRLEKLKQQNIQFQQQQTINQVSQQVIVLALKKVREKLNNQIGSSFHSSVNNSNILLFSKSKF